MSFLFHTFAGLSGLFFLLLAFAFGLQAVQVRSGRGINAEDVGLLLLFGVTQGSMAVLNFLAGLNVGRGKRRKLCIAASILNLLPFMSCFYWTGLPLGIYGLVVLLTAEAQIVFQRVADGLTLSEALDERKQTARIAREDDATEIDVNGDWDQGGPPPKDKSKDKEEWH
ncbi:MAG TPA: hypothetical protein VL860_10250 [Planctomycetota bacterium]|nr:hypothetical protein [Planctomycetota bacterium]